VAQGPAAARVDLLGVEAERATECHELVEQLVRLARASGGGQRLHQPERTGDEGALHARQPVVARPVPIDERPAGAEHTTNRVDGPADPDGVRRLDVEERQDEQRRIEVLRSIATRVAAELRVEAARPYVLGDRVALLPPPDDPASGDPAGGGDAQRA